MFTSDEISQRRAKLSSARLALLKQRLQGKSVQAAQGFRIPRRREQDHALLSSTQQRLWFLDQLQPNSPVYNIPAVLHLEGYLSVSVLEQSINHIITRHETLRTTFTANEEQSMQVIAPILILSVPVIDLTTLPTSEREREVERLAVDESLLPFDLQHGSLMRATLLQFSAEEHILLLTVHHIIADAWSLGIVFTQELVANYIAFSNGLPSPLPELPIQYADFAVWQQRWLQESQEAQSQIAYWKQHLANASGVLELPTDHSRPTIQSFHGASHVLEISPTLTETLRDLSHKEGVTLFMTLVAGFSALLHRYTGQIDMLIGTPIANRTIPELEHLIGFFANTVALRTNLSGNPSFRELLKRIELETIAAYAHQNLPFEKVVEEVHPQRDLSRSPLFQVMFAHNNTPMQQANLPGLTASILPPTTTTAKFDLTLMTEDTGRGLRGYFEYNTDLFEEATIARLAAHFQMVLEGMVGNPDQVVSTLPLLTFAEREQILGAWNHTASAYPDDTCLHHLIEAQVERTPDALALLFEGQTRTYQELNREANQLAHLLQAKGVGAETLVGVSMERSLEMVVALLAILKAGGAYVPIDPSYPAVRLNYLLEDAGVSVVLTQNRFTTRLAHEGVELLCVDPNWNTNLEGNEQNPSSDVHPDNLIYMIYTSGSTGKPKGVMNIHRALCNRLTWMQQVYHLTSEDRVLQKTPFSFDVSVWEFFWPLLAGAGLVVARPGGHQDPGYLATVIAEHRITTLHFVPSMLQAFLLEPHLEKSCASLKQVVTSGEALSYELQERFFARFPNPQVALHNLYGPTEAAIDVTFWECQRGSKPRSIPIGRPIANTQIYILDALLQPTPIGVPGELYIGGLGLARGYHRQEELTTEKFLRDPFGMVDGAQLFKTADLARYRADGAIEFLGRIDHQVKVRGFRIELGEIEAVLSQYPEVQDVVVLAREDVPGDTRLVAYVVAGEAAGREQEWRGYLRERLPEYMIPSVFLHLEALPLTSSGKVDRRSLPTPQTGQSGVEYVAPRTPLEEQLAGIWAEVLGLERVGVQDNFFDIGGHSLKATQIMSRTRQVSGVSVPLRSLFEDPTVAGLVRAIEQVQGRQEAVSSTPIQPSSREQHKQYLLTYLKDLPEEDIQPLLAMTIEGDDQSKQFNIFPVSFAQQRMWMLDQIAPDTVVYTIAGGIHLIGKLHQEAIERTLGEIVSRHEVLRTVFPAIGGRPVQVVELPSLQKLLLHDLSHLHSSEQEREVQRLTSEETQRSFHLATGPLFRPSLVRLAEEEHILLLTVHHIVFDGWSLGVLIQEFMQLYAAFATHQLSPLPALSLQYADYSLWQREWFQGAVMQEQLTFWTQQLSGPLPQLELPTDRSRPRVQTFAGAEYPFKLLVAPTKALMTLSQQEGVTLFMTLTAAFNALLSRYTGQTDILIGIPIANRTRTETEGLIGCFINTLVLRTDLSGDPSFRELLKRVQRVALDAYAHQDLPFEKVVEAVHPQRDLSRSPLFQVMFVLQNAPQPPLKLMDLTVSVLPTPTQVAKFDLTLYVWETAEGLNGYFEYNTDLFEEATIARLAAHFQMVLEGMIGNPDQVVSTLPLLTFAEQEQILGAWNHTASAYPDDTCLHHLIEAQVERTPDALALLFEGQTRTYQELNREANQLAHLLQAKGVGAETLVGVSMERSLEMVVALLAILKAGGAYVPIDPSYPAVRLNYLLEDAGVSVVLTQNRFTTRLAHEGVELLCVDPNWNTNLEGNEQNPSSDVHPDNLIYMIYTSGSTGKPKGVMNIHRALCNRLTWMQQVYHLTSEDRVLQKTPFSFDVSVWEFFWPLLAGAGLVVARPGGHQDPGYLATVIAEHRITTLHFVPSMLQAFLLEPHLEKSCASLKQVVTSGEALSYELQERFFARFPNPQVALHNLYGPTEAAIDVTFWECQRGSKPRSIPIGRPIANTQIYILDALLQPTPIGVPGELYIGGLGLARGYHRQEELTTEKFLRDPFGMVDGAQLFKTADLARYRADGAIEFLGRIDHQVKVRGFRIELGEIEAVLSQYPEVQDVVVLAREDVPGDTRLVAYVVAGEAAGREQEWRGYLRERLPEYMIPSVFLHLEALPLTSSGKVDRRSLPTPQTGQSGVEYVAPRTPLEEQLAGIWAEVLGLERVGVQDNFFDIGGHSLLAVQVLAHIREEMQKSLSLGSFFQAQTVKEMACLIETNEGMKSLYLVPIKMTGTRPPLFCFHPVGGETLMYRALAASLNKEQPIYGLQSQAVEGTMPELESIEAMAREYTAVIRKQQPKGPYYLLGWSMGGVIAVAVASELERARQKVVFVGLLDAYLTSPEDVLTQPIDPFDGLGLIIEAAMTRTRIILSEEEQETLRKNLLALPLKERLPQALILAKERMLLPESLSLEVFKLQEALANTHRTLLNVYDAPLIEAPLVVWWAHEAISEVPSQTNWGRYTKGGVQERGIDGNHFSMIRPPHIQVIAQQLEVLLRTSLSTQVVISS